MDGERGGFGSPIKWDILESEAHVRSDEGLGVCVKMVSGWGRNTCNCD